LWSFWSFHLCPSLRGQYKMICDTSLQTTRSNLSASLGKDSGPNNGGPHLYIAWNTSRFSSSVTNCFLLHFNLTGPFLVCLFNMVLGLESSSNSDSSSLESKPCPSLCTKSDCTESESDSSAHVSWVIIQYWQFVDVFKIHAWGLIPIIAF
jgi:hypothetical protein